MPDLDLIGQSILEDACVVFDRLNGLPDSDRIEVINALRLALSQHSPMRGEPVDCVLWVDAGQVHANSYNPNVVAPPEMGLLTKSVKADGYTQPIVAWPVEDGYEIVDGFHRNRVGRETPALRKRLHGRLPITVIRADRRGVEDRVASTIRHNKARGRHTVDGMSQLVLDMTRRGKNDAWIAAEFGLDPDEVLRLRQVQGLAEMFCDQEFSEAWEAAPDSPGETWVLPGGGSGPGA